MNVLTNLLGAAIGAAILWASLPLFIVTLSAAGFILEAIGIMIFASFPLYILASIGIAIYQGIKERRAAKERRPFSY